MKKTQVQEQQSEDIPNPVLTVRNILIWTFSITCILVLVYGNMYGAGFFDPEKRTTSSSPATKPLKGENINAIRNTGSNTNSNNISDNPSSNIFNKKETKPNDSSLPTPIEDDSSAVLKSIQLFSALKSGDLDMISSILGTGADPNFALKYNDNLLLEDKEKVVPIDFEIIQRMVIDYDLDTQNKVIERVPEERRLEVAYELGFYDILRQIFRSNSTLERNPHLHEYLSGRWYTKNKNFPIVNLGLSNHNGFDPVLPLDLLVVSAFDGNISFIKMLKLKNRLDLIINNRFEFRENSFGLKCDTFTFSPIEAACVSGCQGLVQLLLENNAELSEAAIVWTAKRGHLELLKFLIERGGLLKIGSFIDLILLGAVESGNNDMVEYVMKTFSLNYDRNVCKTAIQSGNLKSVQKCIDSKVEIEESDLKSAADNGHLEIIKYLHDNAILSENIFLTVNLDDPVINGHLEVFKYFYEVLGKPMDDKQEELMILAISSGRIEFVKYLKDKFLSESPLSLKDAVCSIDDDVEMVKIFPEFYEIMNSEQYDLIAETGDLELIKTLFNENEKRERFTSDAISKAAANGHINVVQFLLEKGVIPEHNVLVFPSINGDIEMVRFLLNNGVEATEYSVELSIEFGQTEIFSEYLNRILLSENNHNNNNNNNNNHYLLDLILKNIETIMIYGNLEILKLLTQFALGGGDQFRLKNISNEIAQFTRAAAEFGYLDILKHLNEAGNNDNPNTMPSFSFDKTECLDKAISNGHFGIVKYFKNWLFGGHNAIVSKYSDVTDFVSANLADKRARNPFDD